MPQFFTAAHLKLSLLLAILGVLIALIFTILSASGVTAMIVRPIVSGLIMFVLGSGLYALLAKKVPEAIDAMENHPEVSAEMLSEGGMTDGDMAGAEGGDMTDYASTEGSALDSYDSAVGSSASSNIPRKTGVQIGKEEIIVNGVKFKNQPEVMAETIKQLMDQDKD